jgi:NitT/TauT family transport system substrate-binding protein
MKKSIGYLLYSYILLSLLSACTPAAVTIPPTQIPATLASVSATATPMPVEAPSPTPQQITHLKVGTYNYISNAPLFIARDEGYFTEQGLDVELVDFGSQSNELIPAVITSQLDAAAPSLNVAIFNAISQGSNLKYVADKGFINPDNCPTDAWVGSKTAIDSGSLAGFETIKGKNVVFPTGGTIEYTMDLLLRMNNLTMDDIKSSNISDSAARVDGFKTGAVDVSVLSEPWITRAKTMEAGEVWAPFSALAPNLSMGVIIFGPGILKDKPEAGTRFMVAYLKAVQQFNQGKTDRNVEIIANYTKLKPEDIKASCWTSFKADGTIDVATMQAFQKWAFEKGYVDSLLELDQYYEPLFVNEAFNQLSQ